MSLQLLDGSRSLGDLSLARRIDRRKLRVALRDDPAMLCKQRFQVPCVHGLPTKCRVAILEKRIEAQHFGSVGFGTLELAIVPIGEQRYTCYQTGQRRLRARSDDHEIHAFG